ncbi:hypothetical protein BJ170DRAFT_636928 [Xylariales sp. AK1849]|nr:hypothetical protein BJ170DRAFT_636928 [Xylariales sp. AK1849]
MCRVLCLVLSAVNQSLCEWASSRLNAYQMRLCSIYSTTRKEKVISPSSPIGGSVTKAKALEVIIGVGWIFV